MKKIISIIVVLIIVILGFLGLYFIMKKNVKSNSSKQDVVVSTSKTSKESNEANKSVTSNNAKNNTKNLNEDNSSQNAKSNTGNVNEGSNTQNGNLSNNTKSSVKAETLSSNKVSNSQANSNQNGYAAAYQYYPSSKLSNGPVNDTQLAEIMRKWILTDQYGYSGFFDAVGTMWAKPWLDNIPNSTLVDSFKQVNGANSLNNPITAKELFDASKVFTYAQEKKPIPFTTEQATQYIIQMLKQDNYYSDVTKVVLHKGNEGGGLYYVYVKQAGNKNPYWYVNTNTGYATGV
ncbi:hypothetical protein [Clostridium thermobutyricum]|uniref:hypothetical protein n=1 Tax=Clostridium thermobutyricum TaxID=29372 RepID=UPI0029436C70|nr:hypothetical protein [Clostridium thermobutyricum]